MSYIDMSRILNTLSAKELKELCRNNELKGYSSLGKARLIDLITSELSESILEEFIKSKGLMSENEVSDKEVLAAMNTSRNMDDRTYLGYLLLSLNVKELKQIGKDFYLDGYSRYTKKVELLEFILDSMSEEEHRRLLYNKEMEIISRDIDTAIKKIGGEDRETIADVKIVNEDNHEIEIKFKGFSWESVSYLSITQENIDNPERDCDCRIGSNMGFCNHFWVGFILSVKNCYFNISDWTLTKLPDDFEERLESISLQVSEGESSAGKSVKVIDEGSESGILGALMNQSVRVYEGEVTEVIQRQSEFQDAITIYYHVSLTNVRVGPRVTKKSDYREEDLIDTENLKLRISDKLQEEHSLKENDKIAVNGKLVTDNFWGIMVKNIRKVENL